MCTLLKFKLTSISLRHACFLSFTFHRLLFYKEGKGGVVEPLFTQVLLVPVRAYMVATPIGNTSLIEGIRSILFGKQRHLQIHLGRGGSNNPAAQLSYLSPTNLGLRYFPKGRPGGVTFKP